MKQEKGQRTLLKMLDKFIDYFVFFGKFILPLISWVFVIIFTAVVVLTEH